MIYQTAAVQEKICILKGYRHLRLKPKSLVSNVGKKKVVAWQKLAVLTSDSYSNRIKENL